MLRNGTLSTSGVHSTALSALWQACHAVKTAIDCKLLNHCPSPHSTKPYGHHTSHIPVTVGRELTENARNSKLTKSARHSISSSRKECYPSRYRVRHTQTANVNRKYPLGYFRTLPAVGVCHLPSPCLCQTTGPMFDPKKGVWYLRA